MKIRELPFLRTPYNYDADAVSNETGLRCEDPSLAQQHMAEECDINYIVERFGVTGQLPEPPGHVPTYGDFTGVGDYRSALEAVRNANDSFMSLPANVRERFDNDPALFVDFCSSTDPQDRSLAIELGLIQPPVQPDGVISSPEVVNTEPTA